MPLSNAGPNAGAAAPDPTKESTRKQGASAAAVRSLGIGLLMAGGAAGSLAAGTTLSVKEEVRLAAPPSKTWAILEDFAGWPDWHPAFATTEITRGAGNAEGTVRILTAKDGARFTEELVSHDPSKRTYRYRITESPLPIADYVSTLQVREGAHGTSVVVWSSTFHVNAGASESEMTKVISGVYRTGLDNLGGLLKLRTER